MRRSSALLALVLGACAPPTPGATSESTAATEASSGGSGAPSTASSGGEEGTTAGPAEPTSSGTSSSGEAPTSSTSSSSDASSSGTGSPAGPPADCPRVRVDVPPGEVLNVRPTPSTAMPPVGTLADGVLVDVVAIVQGEVLDGNGEWVEIEGPMIAGFVWSGLVACTLDEAPTEGFFLPLECGKTAKISQGNFGEFSHQGQSAYAFDFQISVGTPMVAVADGVVTHRFAGTKPGDPCYDGGGPDCISKANFVTLLHDDGTSSIYAHLSEVHVKVDAFVPRGAPIGLSGSTGYSTGPHAHVARQEGCGLSHCQSIAVSFADVKGDGVPETGDTVTSGNCP